MKFIDETTIYLKAGDGGNGCIAFRREKFVPKGGPSGGNGGKGGSIFMVGNRNMTTLLDLRYQRKYIAQRGEHGMGSSCHGKDGEDITVEVPLGTIISDNSTGKLLYEVLEQGQVVCVAKGGRGGLGNINFATSMVRAPRKATKGKEGKELEIHVELKLLADVGLVGFPNAGKSTLISAVSAAKPKIADYPFTTLVPNLGIVQHAMGQTFVVADMPGIIEGASEGKGLGIQFLKHIERNKVLVFLIPSTSPDFVDELKILKKECKSFSKKLANKPYLVVISKEDLIQNKKEFAEKIKALEKKEKPLLISGVTGTGLKEWIHTVWTMVSDLKEKEFVVVEEKKEVPSAPAWRP